MADYLTAEGLAIKTVQQMLDELSQDQRDTINATINTASDSPLGQINGTIVSQLREVWEALDIAYNGFNPDDAEGFLLEKLSALTGTVKRPATKSTVVLSCNLDASTTLLAGTHFAHVSGDPENRWTPQEDYTAASGGAQNVDFEAEFAGVKYANAGTLTVIATPVVGWNSCTNAADATPGREADTDAILRTRREEELRASGSATLDAMRADLLAYEFDGGQEILQANVFENVTDTVDENGLPPKAVECVIFDSDPPTLTADEIAQAIFETKPGGILAYGQLSGTATDETGQQHTIGFSRPTEKEVYLEIDLDINIVTGYAGSAAVKAEVVKLNTTDLLVGRDVILQKIAAVCIAFDGVIDVTEIRAGFAASPSGTANLAIGIREIARLDTSRITITENFIQVP